jgi:hypothetical protein
LEGHASSIEESGVRSANNAGWETGPACWIALPIWSIGRLERSNPEGDEPVCLAEFLIGIQQGTGSAGGEAALLYQLLKTA